MGRAGRGGDPSICVFLHLKNQRLPKEMRPFFKTDSSACQRRALTEIFTLHDTDGSIFATNSFMAIYHMSNSVVYATKESRVQCSEACVKQGRCTCSKCKYIHFRLAIFDNFFSCCTNCTATCVSCPMLTKLDADEMVEAILGLGAAEYK